MKIVDLHGDFQGKGMIGRAKAGRLRSAAQHESNTLTSVAFGS